MTKPVFETNVMRAGVRNPQIFYVDPVGGHRGMHYYDFELCPALQKAGVDVTLLTCDETKEMVIPSALPIEYPFQDIFGETNKIIRGLRYLRGMIRVGRSMRPGRSQLAHFHYFLFSPFDYFCIKWLRARGNSIVFTVHDVVPFDANRGDLIWLRRLYHSAHHVIVHAQKNRETIIEEFGVPPEKVSVIPMGPYLRFAEERRMPSAPAKHRLGLASDIPTILFFGQIKTVKGLSILIRAFRVLQDREIKARLIIAGPEWNETFVDYKRLIEDLSLTERVLTRIEYIPDKEVGIYFSAADVVALPYTASYQSAVLYMAYSFSRPVVASAIGGLVEVVEDGVTGRLVPPGDMDSLADALCELLQDAATAEQMGRRGRELVGTRFGWSKIARETARLYSKVAAGN